MKRLYNKDMSFNEDGSYFGFRAKEFVEKMVTEAVEREVDFNDLLSVLYRSIEIPVVLEILKQRKPGGKLYFSSIGNQGTIVPPTWSTQVTSINKTQEVSTDEALNEDDEDDDDDSEMSEDIN